jgi:hypothetical protein
MSMRPLGAAVALVLAAWTTTHAAELTLGPRLEYKHVTRGHEFHVSGAAVAAGPAGRPLLAWAAQEGHANQLYVLHMGNGQIGDTGAPVRVNPEGLAVEALHHPPRLAVAPGGVVYVSWSSEKPKPEGTLFASDLQLSRSLDGGRRFEPPLRVNEDRPISHSFDGLAVAADGTVLLTWIDGHEGRKDPATWVARVVDQGTRGEGIRKVGDDTCVCCRVDAATGAGNTVALTWRRVFPGDIRDMVLAVSRDGGRTFGDAALVSADHWKINACPHRGGAVGLDAKGRVYMSWYTEGSDIRPDLKFAVSTDGRRFGAPKRLHTSATSIPDQARMAVDPAGRAVVVWEESTAVRRRILLRYTLDGGRTLSPIRVLSTAIKAYSPDITFAPDGSFLVAWHEEQFPFLKTVVQPVRLPKAR